MQLTRRADPNHCPGCGERVMRFAAGCALSCSLAGLVAADVMALLGRLLPFL